MIQLSDDFTLSKDTTLGELSTFFNKHYNCRLTTLKIQDCLIVLAWGKETVTAVEQAVKPLMDEGEEG